MRCINEKLFTAIVHKEDELYVAECPEVGTASQGESIEEAGMRHSIGKIFN